MTDSLERDPNTAARSDLDPQENRYRSVFSQILTPVVLVDPAGVIIDCNRAVEGLTGLLNEEIIGKMKWETFIAPEDIERLRSYFRDRTRGSGNPPTSYTFRFISPGGASRYMQANVGFVPGTSDRIVSLTDLSEIVRAQHRTAESEDRYRTAVENTRDGILICLEDTVLFVNTTFCNLTGLTRETVYSMNPLQLLSPADRERLLSVLDDSTTAGRVHRPFEADIVRRDSSSFTSEVSPVNVRFRGKQAVLLTVRDLTERKLAEKQMRDNHKLFKAIVDNSPVAVSVHDSKGTLLLANAAWRKIWGKTEEDQNKLMVPRESLKMDRRDNYLTGYISDVEKIYTTGGDLFIPRLRIYDPPPGGAEWISHHFYAIEDEDGNVDKVVVLTLDLTESFRVRERLEETEWQYKELAQNVPVAVYRTSAEPGGTVLSANPEMMRMFGFSSDEELRSTRVSDLYADPHRREEFIESIMSGRDVKDFEVELRRRDGTIFLASISARGGSGPDGSISYIEGIVRDITSLRRAEMELDRTEKLQSIGSLAGGIAHDFNNILMGIEGNVSLALSGIGDHPAAVELRRVENAVMEAAGLARQLLTFSIGGAPIRENTDIDEILKESVQFMLRGSSVRAEFSIDPDLAPLFTDSGQISQMIGNIVLNSVQAMPDGGTVHLSASNASLDSEEHPPLAGGEYALISIRDSGPGIPANDLSRIFNPYFSTRPEGSGLGLAICYSIASRHGGTIEVYSEIGEGTEFRIYLPSGYPHYGETPEAGKAAAQKEPRHHGDDRILIMDDDPLVREVLDSMLLRLGYRTASSSDGEEAVKLYQEAMAEGDPFAVAILDLTIPGGMGGVRTLRELRTIDPEVRAVVSSGYSTDSVLSNHEEHGFACMLSKPFSLSVLGQCLERALGTEEPGS